MAGRKVPKEVQQLFDKYAQGPARRLKKEGAITMLQNEYGMSQLQADQVFDAFDKDKNGIMSVWEFHQFHQIVGANAPEMIEQFGIMDKDGSGKLDVDEARAGLKAMSEKGGRVLGDKEMDFFIKNCLAEDNTIDLGHFVVLIFRLKVHEGKREKK